MSEPQWTIEDGYPCYDGHQVISVLADPDATPEKVAVMRAAVVAAVRDAGTLRQVREIAALIKRLPNDHTPEGRLLDLLDDD